MLRTVNVPPSLQCETAIPPTLLTSPSVSWPRWCWNRQLSWLGELPSLLRSHCVSLESASATPVYTQKTNRPLIFSFLVQQVQADQEMKTTKIMRTTFRSDVTTSTKIKIKNKRLNQWRSGTLITHFAVTFIFPWKLFLKTKLDLSFQIVKYLTCRMQFFISLTFAPIEVHFHMWISFS